MRFRSVATGPIVACMIGLAGCASQDLERIPYTSAEAAMAEIPGMPNVRFYADTPASVFDTYATRRNGPLAKAASINYLALSGGGAR